MTRISLLLALFFALDKALAIFRVVVILRMFGLSTQLDLDAFNVANNLPDLLFALISGGALAMAFIPVLSEVLSKEGKREAWDLFSRVANFAFLVTVGFAILVALFAKPIVQFVIAPGFDPARQLLVVQLMRLNLISTLIFSISGLVIAGLQSNQHFLLPAMAPIFYNIGQIIGITIFAPAKGIQIGSFTLPAFGWGVQGMVYGVILGALLHLGIQVPGLVAKGFRWTPAIGLKSPGVQKVLRLLGPRVITMFFIQATFIVRDNLASRLSLGDISALTYGWMIQQVPQTLIGTAIGTALLPTLSEQIAHADRAQFMDTVRRATRVLLALTIPISAILSFSLAPFLVVAFGLSAASTNVLLWASQGFLIGLAGHCLLEVAARSFYAQQDAKTPMWLSLLTAVLYTIFGVLFLKPFGAAGISLGDSLAFTIEALLLLAILHLRMREPQVVRTTFWKWFRSLFTQGKLIRSPLFRTVSGSVICVAAIFVFQSSMGGRFSTLISGVISILIGMIIVAPFIWTELRELLHL